MKIVTVLAATLAIAAPTVAVARPPAARLSVAAQAQGQVPAETAGKTTRSNLPVPGYKFIAAAILVGIAGAIVGLASQDGTPDSN